MSDPRAAIAESIRSSLTDEARRNELRVGTVRLAGFAMICALNAWLLINGQRPLRTLLMTLGLVGISLLIIWGASRFHRRWFGFVVPALDVAMLYALIRERTIDQPMDVGLAVRTGLMCALFAATAGLRFDRLAAAWTTICAAALLLILIGPRIDFASVLLTLTILASIGVLTVWLTDLVRRSIESTRSRALLSRFLPRSVVEGAFADPMAVLAEPKEVEATVLVSDLRGFTAFAENLPPRQVLAFLNELQGELAAAVQENGGVVDKFMGDGMLAVFGAPEPVKDHAARALAAAHAIRARVSALRLQRNEAIGVGVGIHSGKLVAGCLGSGDRLEFTIIGDTVNIASRLEAMTKQFNVDVVISEVTAVAAGAQLQPLGEVSIRGRVAPLRVMGLPSMA